MSTIIPVLVEAEHHGRMFLLTHVNGGQEFRYLDGSVLLGDTLDVYNIVPGVQIIVSDVGQGQQVVAYNKRGKEVARMFYEEA